VKVTKYEHATLLIERADDLLVIDPGSFLTPPDFHGTVAVVITHEHADHWTPEQLRRVLEDSPEARIFGPQGVVDAASEFEVEVVTAGQTVEIGAFTLQFFGGRHNVIHASIPVVDNLGVLVNDELFHPGDSYTVPDVPVETLAAPVGAPWLKIGEAMDYVLAVGAGRVFPIHEMTLSVAGFGLHSPRLERATTERGGEYFVLAPGESIAL
tara:strand:+ start:34627 stop:35259 length:633 start_codon:yes stop_codon:yes gene_type:complete